MTINEINYLLLERRGCNYSKNNDISNRSDVGNHRVFVEFTDKNGVDVCGDFSHCYAYDDTKKKHPLITSDVVLHAHLQFENASGAWGYSPAVDTKKYTYNLSDILNFVNAISAEQYSAIKWVERIEFVQESGANFRPASKIVEYAKKNRMETSENYGDTILHMYTGNYKYLSYKIEPFASGKEKVIITLELI